MIVRVSCLLSVTDPVRRPVCGLTHEARHSPWHAERSETRGRRRWPRTVRPVQSRPTASMARRRLSRSQRITEIMEISLPDS